MMRIFSGMFLAFFDPGRDGEGALRIDAIEHPWEGDHFADVLGSANPGDGAFQAQAEARVRHAAVAPQVEIPLERFLREVVLAHAR